MKVLVLYDSVYGNTAKVAEKIAGTVGKKHTVFLKSISQIDAPSLKQYDLVFLGSPTHGGQPTPAIQKFVQKITPTIAAQTKWACYDTRLAAQDVKMWLKMLMGVIGYAAPKMAKMLSSRGGVVLGHTGIIVSGKEGPLKKGELAEVGRWCNQIIKLSE